MAVRGELTDEWRARGVQEGKEYAFLTAEIARATDAGPDLRLIRDDALERPFILLGMAAFALLLPLAVTSNQAAMRALGRGWRRLHRSNSRAASFGLVRSTFGS